jgi:hypothetical protein
MLAWTPITRHKIAKGVSSHGCDPKCSHFKVGILASYSQIVNYPKALKIKKISERD